MNKITIIRKFILLPTLIPQSNVYNNNYRHIRLVYTPSLSRPVSVLAKRRLGFGCHLCFVVKNISFSSLLLGPPVACMFLVACRCCTFNTESLSSNWPTFLGTGLVCSYGNSGSGCQHIYAVWSGDTATLGLFLAACNLDSKWINLHSFSIRKAILLEVQITLCYTWGR